MKRGWQYALLNIIAALLLLVGVFHIFSVFAGLMRTGGGDANSLFSGISCAVPGVILLVLADCGARLVRIGTKLGTLPEDYLADSSRPKHDH